MPSDNRVIKKPRFISRAAHPSAVYPERAHRTTFDQSFLPRKSQDQNDLGAEVAIIKHPNRFKCAVDDACSSECILLPAVYPPAPLGPLRGNR